MEPDFSFKITKNPFSNNQPPTNSNSLSSYKKQPDYFENLNDKSESPKFNTLKEDDLINDIEKEIPSSNLNFKETVVHEIQKRESKKSIVDISNKTKQEEVEHGKKSHFEYLKIMRDNKDPLGVLKTGLKEIKLDELAKHNKTNDLWTAIHGKVFDLTMYLDYHPGGEKMLMQGAGIDSSDLFNHHHPWVNVHNLVGKLQIGYLKIE